jgi:hypothetical protein
VRNRGECSTPYGFAPLNEGAWHGKSVLLLASLATASPLASGAALAVTPTGADAPPNAKGRDTALKSLIAMRGGPPGAIAIV